MMRSIGSSGIEVGMMVEEFIVHYRVKSKVWANSALEAAKRIGEFEELLEVYPTRC